MSKLERPIEFTDGLERPFDRAMDAQFGRNAGVLLFDTFTVPVGEIDIDAYSGSEIDVVGEGWAQIPGGGGWNSSGTRVINNDTGGVEGSWQKGGTSVDASGAVIDVGVAAKTIEAQIFHNNYDFHWIGVIIRYVDQDNFLFARLTHNNGIQLIEEKAGVWTVLASNVTITNWKNKRVRMTIVDGGVNVSVTVNYNDTDYVVAGSSTAAQGATKVGAYFYKNYSHFEEMTVMG